MPRIGVGLGQADIPRQHRRPRRRAAPSESGLARALGERSYRAPAVRAVQRSAPSNQVRAPRSVWTPRARTYASRPARYARARRRAFAKAGRQWAAIYGLAHDYGSSPFVSQIRASTATANDPFNRADRQLAQLANRDFLNYLNGDLWPKAKGMYPLKARPSMSVGNAGPGAEAITRWPDQRVVFSPDAAQAFERGDPYAKGTALHEWAHVGQAQRPGGYAVERDRLPQGSYSSPSWQLEGGADTFAVDAAKRLGIPYIPSKSYAPYRRRVRRSRNENWIMRGQFR